MKRRTTKQQLAKTEIFATRLLGWDQFTGATTMGGKADITPGTIADTVRAPVSVMAARLGISQQQIKNMIRAGMPAKRIGKRLWVLAGDVLTRCESVTISNDGQVVGYHTPISQDK